MENQNFLTIDNQLLSLKQALGYLQNSGKLNLFIGEVLRQYVLEQEFKNQVDAPISSEEVDQHILDFRLKNDLGELEKFQNWLINNGIDYNAFRNQFSHGVKLQKMRTKITEPKLQSYFIEHKIFLDKVILSRIVVTDKELAEELKSQIAEREISFEEAAREYSLANDRTLGGMMGPLSRGRIPDELRAYIDAGKLSEVIGPIYIEEHWSLFRLDEIIPASLDGQLKQDLESQLFEEWIAEKIKRLDIKLQEFS